MFAGSPSSVPSRRSGSTLERLTMAFGVLLFCGLRSPAIAVKESPHTAVDGARNRLAHLEELSDDELEQLHSQFKRIQSIAKTSAWADGLSDSTFAYFSLRRAHAARARLAHAL